MGKLAVFVEGQTEQLFVQNLLTAIAGHLNITIDKVDISGGSRGTPRIYTEITATGGTGKKYYALIYNCTNDSRVASDILENHQKLVVSGYTRIIGLRDIYPQLTSELPRIRKLVEKILPAAPVAPKIIFAIREIEAWFLGEYTHFSRIDAALTDSVVARVLGCQPQNLETEGVAHPAHTLDLIYREVGRRYKKERSYIQRTISALSFDDLYLGVISRSESLKEFCSQIDDFLS